jgi:hypothetical protein
VKTKTIKAVLRKKIDAWLASIDDEQVREILKQNIVVTGGCIPSMLLGEKVNDFDVYLRSRDAVICVADYYIKQFKLVHPGSPLLLDTDDPDRVRIMVPSDGVTGEKTALKDDEDDEDDEEGEWLEQPDEKGPPEEDPKPKYRPVFFSTNAITLSDRLQLIIRFYGEPSEIHENYDFVHCTNYWTSWEGNVVLNKDALESLLTKELRYVGSKYPLCSLIRLRKFIKRGWTINAGQVLKIAMQLNGMNLLDIRTLEDQLTGVDALFFAQLIAALKNGEKESFDMNYAVEVIDRMF